MKFRFKLALGGAAVAFALMPVAASAGASGPPVTVRVEGLKRTLLAPTVVRTHPGSITKGGVAKGLCPAETAQGALDVATHHHWSGKWFSSFQEYEIFTILGDHESGMKNFWDIFVNNVAASTGACEIRLHRGDQILFAAVSASGTAYPTALDAPRTVVAGKSFRVKVLWYTAKGKRKPLGGARVTGKGVNVVTDVQGLATITPAHRGRLVLQASETGYIRSAPVRIHVS